MDAIVYTRNDDEYDLIKTTLDNDMDDEIWQLQLPKEQVFPIEEFLSIGFTYHICILTKVKEFDERLFYIKRCAQEHYSVEALKRSLASDDFHHQGELPNNFLKTIPAAEQASRVCRHGGVDKSSNDRG